MLWPETVERLADGTLAIGGVSTVQLAEEFGTPLYVFDERTLRNRARRAVDAFSEAYPDSRVVYAGKAYLSPAVVRVLHGEGLGLDVVSGGELYAGLRAGVPARDITFHGNNKSEQEVREAIHAGIGSIVVDNDVELALLDRLTRETGHPVDILLRLNPGVDVHTHEKIKTGATDSKFGFPVWDGSAERAVERAGRVPGVRLQGYHAHIGSQIFDPEAYAVTIETMVAFAARMRRQFGQELRVLSPGGGFGIAYEDGQEELDVAAMAQVIAGAVRDACTRAGLALPHLVVEPGRAIVGPAAIALYRVGAVKEISGIRRYVAVDGGMADNIRPALYGARYTAALANHAEDDARETVTIAGKFCESGDILIKDIALPALRPGDLLALPAVGAYTLPMASNYNLAPRPAVVMVGGGEARLIRRRETYDDLLRADVLPSIDGAREGPSGR